MFQLLFKSSGWADFSNDRIYRYELGRLWNDNISNHLVFICLNPSTADADNDDPTVRKCIMYAKQWNYDGLILLNLFAYRATDPQKLFDFMGDPVGDRNDLIIQNIIKDRKVIVAWGNHGGYLNRDVEVLKMIKDPYCMGITKGGFPKHPLYLRKNIELRRYSK